MNVKRHTPDQSHTSRSLARDRPKRRIAMVARVSAKQMPLRMPEHISTTMPVMASGFPADPLDAPATAAPNPGQGWLTRLITRFRRTDTKGRLLWIGDAAVPTGFATVTHSVIEHLCVDWDVTVSGINYDGSPHAHPYNIIPAWQGGDMWGMDRFSHLCAEFDPDIVVINNDWWNVARFQHLAPSNVPIIGYMPVDGANLDPSQMKALNKIAAAVWYTDFGYREAVSAGFKGPRHVVPHGIDTKLFRPHDRNESRKALKLRIPENAFIVGNLNRNQPRKRLDVTIQIFADWVKKHNVSDAFLLLHCAKQDSGWDLDRVAKYHGVADRVIFTGKDEMREMDAIEKLPLIYSSRDVPMTTTLGEGWGLTTLEGMACGVPQIVPDWAALGEWPAPAVKIPCSRQLVHPEINTVGALVDDEPFIAELQAMHLSKSRRETFSRQGLAHVRRSEFQWPTIARQLEAVMEDAMHSKRPVKRRKHAAARHA